MRVPAALKIFMLSLVFGVAGGYFGFRIAYWLALQLLKGEYAELMAMLIAMLGALLVGGSAAITAGVMAGRSSAAGPGT